MVGFPGEKKSDFDDSIKLIDEVKFDFVEVYQFSPRPNTLACKMQNQVDKITAYERYITLQERVLHRFKDNYLGVVGWLL